MRVRGDASQQVCFVVDGGETKKRVSLSFCSKLGLALIIRWFDPVGRVETATAKLGLDLEKDRFALLGYLGGYGLVGWQAGRLVGVCL